MVSHGETCRLGDLADRGAVETLRGEYLHGALDDLLAPQIDEPGVLDVGVDFFPDYLHSFFIGRMVCSLFFHDVPLKVPKKSLSSFLF